MASLPKNGLLELPPNAVEEIRKIHNLDKPERVDEAIDILEAWIKKQDHIVKKDFDRGYLGRVLLASKGSVEKSKRQIDRLCTLKTLLPKYFVVTNIKTELKQFLEVASIFPLPKVTKDYYRVLMIKLNDTAFTQKNFLEYFQYNIIICEYLKAHDYVNGFIIVQDYQDANIMELVTKLDTVELQQYMSIIVEGFGARLKGIHILTQSKVIEIFMKLVKQFLSQKIGNRMNVHKTLHELYEVVPRHIFPKDYGGDERSVKELQANCGGRACGQTDDMWIDELSSKEHVEYLEIMKKACTNEKLRRIDKFNDEYMGTPGAFRNLSVD